jgi:hypothetical protein
MSAQATQEHRRDQVPSFAKQLVAQLQTLVGEASPSLQPPRRRWSMDGVGGCGVFRYPLCGVLRPATPSRHTSILNRVSFGGAN